MSLAMIVAVLELDLPREQKLVLTMFADHANDDGFCYPSLARIAWKCGYAQVRSVSEIVDRLIEHEVLAVIEESRGRLPTMYQVRPHNAKQLPPFDPRNFQTARGAKNAPQEKEPDANPLNEKGMAQPVSVSGAENAPQMRRGTKNAPQMDGFAVRSNDVAVRSSARSGAVATAPEPLNPLTKDARARAGPGQSPARATSPQVGGEEFLLNNQALQLGISQRQRNETLADYRGRVAAAHDRKLHAAVEARRAERLGGERTEPCGTPTVGGPSAADAAPRQSTSDAAA